MFDIIQVLRKAYQEAAAYADCERQEISPRLIHDDKIVYDIRHNGITETVKDLRDHFGYVA